MVFNYNEANQIFFPCIKISNLKLLIDTVATVSLINPEKAQQLLSKSINDGLTTILNHSRHDCVVTRNF